MERFTLDNDIKVFYVTATSFPEGIMDAFQRLHALAPSSKTRLFFGISRPEKGVITYRAAAQELKNREAEQCNCETLVIRKGQYICKTIGDFRGHEQKIGEAFQELLHYPGIEPDGYCVEWYLDEEDVRCMVWVKD